MGFGGFGGFGGGGGGGFKGGGGGGFKGGGKGPGGIRLPKPGAGGSGNVSLPSVSRHRSITTPGTLDTIAINRPPRTGSGRSQIPSIVQQVRLTALLFGRPSSKLVREDILPHLDYFNYDTGKYFNFRCIGFDIAKSGEAVVATVAGQPWAFSDKAFVEIKDKLQQESQWKYSGGADLLVCNELLAEGPSTLMLSEGVAVNLDQLLKDEAILNFETFFQGIVDFAKRELHDNPAAAWSDKQGLRIGGSALRDGILSFLPESLRKHVKQAAHFAVRKIGK